MHISLEIPDQKSGLDAALLKQFAEIQRQLLEVVKSQKSSMSSEHHDEMMARIDALIDALAHQAPKHMRNRTFGSNF